MVYVNRPTVRDPLALADSAERQWHTMTKTDKLFPLTARGWDNGPLFARFEWRSGCQKALELVESYSATSDEFWLCVAVCQEVGKN